MSEPKPKFELSPHSKKQVKRFGHIRLGGYGAMDPDPIKVTDPNREFEGEIWRMYVPDGILKEIVPPTTKQSYMSKAAEVIAKRKELEAQQKELQRLEREEAQLAEQKRLDEERLARLAAANPQKGAFKEKGVPAPQAEPEVEAPQGEQSDPAPLVEPAADPQPATKKSAGKNRLAAAAKKRGRRKNRKLSESKPKPKVEVQEAPDPVVLPETDELDVITSDNIELPTKTEIRSYTRAEAENMAKTLGIWDSIEGTGKHDGRSRYRTAPDIEQALLAHVEKLRS